ncbi:DUF2782 domain-containing protein [Luteimonas sp. M1R5S18]|uniref:DUF2782 domain-containing protein n=1 Tax=Luteimonas rhizosphaericola TaxID=3042024 RepID=A0ABT6JLV7_9GAMM|nr:DUF2782 domain-containing protein [Luteimonas rhizosphaericola]MDH5831076.1 DUF2782 domain-containing protein [Luteimonas rhizosphaericola]
MRTRARLLPIFLSALVLGACASSGPATVEIPPGAEEATRTEANGDVITEYRVNGELRVVQVTPSRGPSYHLYVRDGRVLSTREGDDAPQTYFKLFGW